MLLLLLVSLPLYQLEPRPLHDIVLGADAVVVARVVDAHVDGDDAVFGFVVRDVARGGLKNGERFELRSDLANSFEDQPSFDVGSSYMLILAPPTSTNRLRAVPFWVDDTGWEPPAPVAHTGKLWVGVSMYAPHTGLLLPDVLPVTFTDGDRLRTCRGSALNAYQAWFTWEDWKKVDWKKLTIKNYQTAATFGGVRCAVDAAVPQLVRCPTCSGEPMQSVQRVICTSPSKLRLVLTRTTSTWPASFRVAVENAPAGFVAPELVEPSVSQWGWLVEFIDRSSSLPMDRGSLDPQRFDLIVSPPRSSKPWRETDRVERDAVFPARLRTPVDATHVYDEAMSCTVEPVSAGRAP